MASDKRQTNSVVLLFEVLVLFITDKTIANRNGQLNKILNS